MRETHSKNHKERLRDTVRESTIEIDKELERVREREGKMDGMRDGSKITEMEGGLVIATKDGPDRIISQRELSWVSHFDVYNQLMPICTYH